MRGLRLCAKLPGVPPSPPPPAGLAAGHEAQSAAAAALMEATAPATEDGGESVGGSGLYYMGESEATRVALYRRLKRIMRGFTGRRSMHNFSEGIASSEGRAMRRTGRPRVHGGLVAGGREFVVVSVCGPGFLFGQLRRMMGALIAVCRGIIPEEYIHLATQPWAFLPIPACPPHLLILDSCSFDMYEAKKNIQIRPRPTRYTVGFTDPEDHRAVLAFRQHILSNIANLERREDRSGAWMRDEVEACAADMRRAMDLALLRRPDANYGASAGTGAEGGSGAAAWGAVPREYRRALQLLREADIGGRWPRTTVQRRQVIDGPSGDSFSLGWMPVGLAAPAANTRFPELHDALRRLEIALMPMRPPSSTIAVNRNAQFRPHRDTGAGNGQTGSLIVGLGDYTGGETVVEGEEHNIRYNPLEFDGWNQRHWTNSFRGERFSVVWFTPMGCKSPELQASTGEGQLVAALPRLGWGSYRRRGLEAQKAATTALQAGFKHLDTAATYGNYMALRAALRGENPTSEIQESSDVEGIQVAGELASSTEDWSGVRREQIFITSKVGPEQMGYEGAIRMCLEALQGLSTGYLDLLLIHWPGVSAAAGDATGENMRAGSSQAGPRVTAAELRWETWKAMRDLVERGLVRHVGVSNFEREHLEDLISRCHAAGCAGPEINQIEVHPLWPQIELVDYCASQNVLVQAYAPLGSNEGKNLLLGHPVVVDVANQLGRSPAQVLLAWALQRCSGGALVGSSDASHLKQNLEAVELRLSDADFARLAALSTTTATVSGDMRGKSDAVKFCWNPAGIA